MPITDEMNVKILKIRKSKINTTMNGRYISIYVSNLFIFIILEGGVLIQT